jgi:hypothetical protein
VSFGILLLLRDLSVELFKMPEKQYHAKMQSRESSIHIFSCALATLRGTNSADFSELSIA